MLRSLAQRGWSPDFLVGASAGALNAAFLAGRPFDATSVDALQRVWQPMRRQDVFPFAPARHVLALTGLRPSLCAPHGLRRLVERHLGYERFEDAAIPVHVVATEVLSGLDVLLSEGDAVPALLASTAIPAVFPTVELDGRALFDGGIANNTPISHAVALGADRVVVLPAGVACGLPTAPRTALGTAMHALTLLIEQRLALDVETFRDVVELVVVPPLCPLAVSSTDFSRADELIERARTSTHAWIDAGGPALPHPERFVALHSHAAKAAASRPAEHAA
jgi:NTE family protein